MAQQEHRPAAFVTGASYGVGAATALALAHAGYDLALSATRTENLKETLASLEGLARVVPLALDLRAPASIERAMTTVIDAFGRRSEEHTSELQSLRHLVCRLLL